MAEGQGRGKRDGTLKGWSPRIDSATRAPAAQIGHNWIFIRSPHLVFASLLRPHTPHDPTVPAAFGQSAVRTNRRRTIPWVMLYQAPSVRSLLLLCLRAHVVHSPSCQRPPSKIRT